MKYFFTILTFILFANCMGQTQTTDTSKRITVLHSVTVYSNRNVLNPVEQMADEEAGRLLAGKKNGVINISNANSNLSTKIGRELFAKIPGVFVYDMDGSGNQVNISTRGLDPHRSWEYNVRQNGVLLNSDMYGYPASHYSAPMESIEKVEMISGTAALQYGAQFGGLINYVTKSADSGKAFSFENLSTAGSFGLFSTYNAVGGHIGKWSYYAYFSKRVADGYRKNSESNADAQFASLQYHFNANLYLKAELGHSKYKYHLPGPLSDDMFAQDPRQSNRDRNWYSPDMYIPSLTLNWNVNNQTTVILTSSAAIGTRNSVQFIGFADAFDTIDHVTNDYKPRQVDIDRFHSYTNEARINHRFRIGNLSSTFAGGIQLMTNHMRRSQLGKGTTASDYDLTLITPGWGRDLHYKTNNIAVFAENTLYLTPALSVSPGFRYESGTTRMSGNIAYYNADKTPLSIDHHFPLWGISTQYRFANSRLYAGITQAYRPMIFKDVIPASALEVIDPALKDAKGYTAEAGFSGKWKGIINYDLSVFHITYNNRIGGLILQDNAGNYYNYKTNIGNSATDGVELYAEWMPVTGTNFRYSVFTSTSWMNGRYTKGTVATGNSNTDIKGNKLEVVPEWITRNGISAGYKTVSASLQYSYVSKTYSDALNTPIPAANGSKGPVPGYSLWDMSITVHFLSNYQLKGGINNIADKQYFTKRPTFYPDPGIWPSDGRSLYITVGCRF
ncbi:TonB-dependent receptor [Niastella yeongjuensis]|uniref:TonB-dependent receptor n=1 Tax=Niastella yeongjuensis TaxID=354355 RepID=A0A1V9EXB6_9BACT|nr:TonB-dependent receptor [Niastella yeongjuensis]OQP50766.1 TonB-dependent receptor [Niastella yeongjuensis]SEN18934.1 Fe(3+) dicitrate transport protein [Niastella yeongjuensis]